MFLFSLTMSYAQNNKFIPPDWRQTEKTLSVSVVLPALQIDSIFMENLNTVLFDKNDRFMNRIIFNPDSKYRHFDIRFEKKDSLNYWIVVELSDTPTRRSKGFFENNGFFYWFGGEVPPNIILETKSKRRFSYKEVQIIFGIYDPILWYLMYNSETGSIEVKGEDFY